MFEIILFFMAVQTALLVWFIAKTYSLTHENILISERKLRDNLREVYRVK